MSSIPIMSWEQIHNYLHAVPHSPPMASHYHHPSLDRCVLVPVTPSVLSVTDTRACSLLQRLFSLPLHDTRPAAPLHTSCSSVLVLLRNPSIPTPMLSLNKIRADKLMSRRGQGIPFTFPKKNVLCGEALQRTENDSKCSVASRRKPAS